MQNQSRLAHSCGPYADLVIANHHLRAAGLQGQRSALAGVPHLERPAGESPGLANFEAHLGWSRQQRAGPEVD